MVQFPRLQAAIADPESANLAQLWREVEQQLAGLERDEKLRAAGEAIALLAELHFARAQWLLNNWEERWSDRPEFDEEPLLTDDMLAGFLRQTMSLNLDDILESFTQTRTRREPEDPIVGEVEKQAVLNWLEQETKAQQEKEQALSVAHDENVSEWIQLIRTWLQKHHTGANFSALAWDLQQTNPHMSLVTVWLGLLLGGFAVEPVGDDFYSQDFWING
ncbi:MULTISPECIES: hypothetical protein [unclassified Leptolyngbya]|uniref:hypothetical protein n=1 Tax=unclassified Leptolyngbya TaxID=2650499 RepID=UPI0016886E4F|nr:MULTISPECIES: hypothetical protein [unclassified Leptolyngbya]MBD1909861.1 hypothetical protein [Leptolyngbya sp. FACHB-8]MBD2156957.1 hypothetical protein [Leptolyngbya sp. FACHB-16]